MFNQRLFSKAFRKVRYFFKFVCIVSHAKELQLNMVELLYLKGLYHFLLPKWEILKTTSFNGVEYSETELLSFNNINKLLISKISKPPKLTYSEKES